MMTREGNGATTVRAVRIDTPLRIDGALDEDLYQRVAPMTDFIQIEPDDGTVASERTDLWLAFDGDNVYVVVSRAGSSQMDRLVATEMRRDNGSIWSGNDIVVVHVRHVLRSAQRALSFTINALGGRSDGQVTNERQFNPRLESGVGRQDRPVRRRLDGGGRHAVQVAALPAGRAQIWGFNAHAREPLEERDFDAVTRVPARPGHAGVDQTA